MISASWRSFEALTDNALERLERSLHRDTRASSASPILRYGNELGYLFAEGGERGGDARFMRLIASRRPLLPEAAPGRTSLGRARPEQGVIEGLEPADLDARPRAGVGPERARESVSQRRVQSRDFDRASRRLAQLDPEAGDLLIFNNP